MESETSLFRSRRMAELYNHLQLWANPAYAPIPGRNYWGTDSGEYLSSEY